MVPSSRRALGGPRRSWACCAAVVLLALALQHHDGGSTAGSGRSVVVAAAAHPGRTQGGVPLLPRAIPRASGRRQGLRRRLAERHRLLQQQKAERSGDVSSKCAPACTVNGVCNEELGRRAARRGHVLESSQLRPALCRALGVQCTAYTPTRGPACCMHVASAKWRGILQAAAVAGHSAHSAAPHTQV